MKSNESKTPTGRPPEGKYIVRLCGTGRARGVPVITGEIAHGPCAGMPVRRCLPETEKARPHTKHCLDTLGVRTADELCLTPHPVYVEADVGDYTDYHTNEPYSTFYPKKILTAIALNKQGVPVPPAALATVPPPSAAGVYDEVATKGAF